MSFLARSYGLVMLAATPLLGGALCGTANSAPLIAADQGDAYYSPNIDTLQAASPLGLRTYLSTDQKQYMEQSYVWGGPLIADDGTTSYAAFEMQRNDPNPLLVVRNPLPSVTAAFLYNDGSGFQFGAVSGKAESEISVAFNSYPWSATATQLIPAANPEFVDIRVVEGQIGAKGAIYELTTSVISNTGHILGSYVRAKDTTGIMQWGYGPSGFSPMWIFDNQREAINASFQGSVANYLAATGDPMRSQGQYYFTMPMLKVQEFQILQDGNVVKQGTDGYLWFDSVDRSYDLKAQQVVYGDSYQPWSIGWTEFSVAIPATGEAFKIGQTVSSMPETFLGLPLPHVGSFPYATLVSRGSKKAPNGAYVGKTFWGINAIHLNPVESSKWIDPVTGNAYYLAWDVNLDKSKDSEAVRLHFEQLVPNEEVVIPGAGARTVMEGVYGVTGTIGSRHVKGWSLLEVQNPGQLTPPSN